MNIYLLVIYLIIVYFSNSSRLLAIIPLVKALLATLMPPKVMEAEILRGDVLRISYVVADKQYVALLPMNRTNIRRAVATTADGRLDVLDIVKTYAGPCCDFLGADVTPEMINENWISLTIGFGRKGRRVFNKNDVIVF